jgi:hypothetical protein
MAAAAAAATFSLLMGVGDLRGMRMPRSGPQLMVSLQSDAAPTMGADVSLPASGVCNTRLWHKRLLHALAVT